MSKAPTKTPPFTLSDVKKHIPEHCFKRSLLQSSSYLVYDLIIISLLVYSSSWIDRLPISPLIRFGLLWPLYWYFCGCFCTGVWVIGHECGHGAFAENDSINDAVGFIFHSLLLVPYFSWKHSHRHHHSNNANVKKDEVFVPRVESRSFEASAWEVAPVMALGKLFVTLTLGWPLYLAFNAGGRPYPRWANHFNPYSPIFSRKERLEVVISDLGLILVLAGLSTLGHYLGYLWLIKTYFIPYLIVNGFLVLITLLQHTHPSLPHYDDEHWDWLRGSLSTVDRDFGFLNVIFHNITDTHVVHHLFSKMPHYHAKEATEAVKVLLGEYYQHDSRNVLVASWKDWIKCRFVSPDPINAGVLWYRN